MTHSVVAAIEQRDQLIAHLERRLQERENTVSLMADELAFMAVRCAELRRDRDHWRERNPSGRFIAGALEHKDVSPFERHPIDVVRRP